MGCSRSIPGPLIGNSFPVDPTLIGLLFAVAAGTSFLAGFYPALVLSGFDPLIAFKNRTAPRGSGSNLFNDELSLLYL